MSCAPCLAAAIVAGPAPCCDECAQHDNHIERAYAPLLFRHPPPIQVREVRPMVGRSFPASELAEHDARVEQLRQDVAHHDSTGDDATAQTNWAALTHKINGYVLRWGQFKASFNQSLVTWWGSDDETEFSNYRNEYNNLLAEVKGFTAVKTTATPAEVSTKGMLADEEDTKGKLFGVVPSWLVPVGLGLAAIVLLGPTLGSVLGGMAAAKAVSTGARVAMGSPL